MTSSFIKRFKVRLAIRLAIKLVGSVSLIRLIRPNKPRGVCL